MIQYPSSTNAVFTSKAHRTIIYAYKVKKLFNIQRRPYPATIESTKFKVNFERKFFIGINIFVKNERLQVL